MKRTLGVLTFALPLTLAACGAPDASAAAQEQAISEPAAEAPRTPGKSERLGTLEATIDGRPTVFHIVSATIRGQPYASAAWQEPSEGRIWLAVGGFDNPEPPFDSFEQGGQGGQPVSFGDYHGPVLSLVLDLPADPQPFSVQFPNEGSATSLVYLPTASLEDTRGMFLAAEGTLSLTEVALSGGRMRARGTFSGTFRSLGSGESVEITDGRYSVEGVPNLKEITPDSG